MGVRHLYFAVGDLTSGDPISITIWHVIWQYVDPDPQTSSLVLKIPSPSYSLVEQNTSEVLAYTVTSDFISKDTVFHVTSLQTV